MRIRRDPEPVVSFEGLPHVDQGEGSLGAAVVLDVADPRVERQVLRHLLVRVEIDGIEAGPPRLGLRELEEGPTKALPALGGGERRRCR
jgi:hypothetical protein